MLGGPRPAACSDAWKSLWEAVAEASLRRCTVFSPRDLANTAWAYAKAGHSARALLYAIKAETAKRVCAR